jgi:hypothetical protein
MSKDLLNRSNEFVGLDQRLWIVAEVGGYGKAATGGLFPIAANGLEHISAKIDFMIPREDSKSRSGRSRVSRHSGKKEAKFSYEGYIIPGTPDGSNHPTLPDVHPMLLSAFGSVDLSNPAQIVYGLTRSTTTTFRFLEEGSHFSRLCVGCVADTVSFMLPGDGKAMMKVEGFGQDVISSGESVAATLGTAVNAIAVATGTGQRFEVNSYIDIVDPTDGNTRLAASRIITGIAGDTLTFDGAAVTFPVGAMVIGAAPDFVATSGENALLGLKGDVSTASFGSLGCDILSAEITLKNNYTQRKMNYGNDTSCGFIADKRRDVNLKLEILLTKSNFDFYQRNKSFIADSVTIVLQPQLIPAPINSPTGRTMTFHFNKVEFNVPQIEMPADGFVKLTLEGVALATGTNTVNNEVSLTIS